jgi:hypothetical protein
MQHFVSVAAKNKNSYKLCTRETEHLHGRVIFQHDAAVRYWQQQRCPAGDEAHRRISVLAGLEYNL